MFKPSFVSTFISIAFLLSACSGDDDRPEEDGITPIDRTYAVFSPVTSDLPIPNDILFSSETAGDGTMTAGSSPGNPVIEGIDAMDGASVLAPIDVSFSGSLQASQDLDAASFVVAGSSVIPNPSQNVFLLPLSYPGGDALLQASVDGLSVEVPTFAKAIQYQRAVAASDVNSLLAMATPDARAEIISLDGGTNNVLRIYPLQPLLPQTKYLVVVTTLQDANGNDVLPAIAYDYISDPNTNISASPSLPGLRAAIQGWERLANGYFGFMQTVFSAAGVGASAPSGDSIIFSMTFTTTGTDAIFKSIAAPETFFEKSLITAHKHDAIRKLASGVYNVSGDNTNLSDATDMAINSTLNFLLTSEALPGPTPNPLYNPTIAGAIGAGAGYSTIAADASAAYLMQVAAGEAALNVHNGDGVTIATEAVGTVAAMADAVSAPVNYVFPVPAARPTNFYRVDPADEIYPDLEAPALVYQGEITLPYFLSTPDGADGSPISSESWTADETIGAIIDGGRGNPAGTTPPSAMITYRYPFPGKQSDQTFPILVTMPESSRLSDLDITKPAEGWPVVIFVHGITTDRSASLPLADALAWACVAPDLSGPSGLPCYATVSIDQPLHGFTPSGSTIPGFLSVNDPDYDPNPNVASNTPSENLIERHFNFTADANLSPIAMDYTDEVELGESGSLFINLSNFTNARDILRQMTIDLLNVSASLDSMDVDGNGTADDLDPANVYFIAHSLGGINGIPFLALNNDPQVQASPFSTLPTIKAAVVMSSGSAPPTLLVNSPSYSPSILGGLAAASSELQVGRSGFETYMSVFQGLLDSVDPLNFAASLNDANASTGILLTEVIGSGASAPSDRIIPNGADPMWGFSPLNGLNAVFAGTEPLINAFSAVNTADATSDGDPAVIVTRFTEGSHATPLVAGNIAADPYTTQASFDELLIQIISFFALDGDVPGSIVANPDVVEP